MTLALLATIAGWLAGAREAPRDAVAGTAVRMDLSELVLRADLVVEGRVLSAAPLETSSGRIDTEYVLSVDRTFWGDDLGVRTLRLPGGVLADGRGMIVPGMTWLVPGEDVVLMLSTPTDGVRIPVGLSQGRFRVLVDRDGAKVAVRGHGGLTLANGASGSLEGGGGAGVHDYAALVAEIESAVAVRRALGEGGK